MTRPGRAVASRFVAGETLDQAMVVARELDRMRTTAMLDHLGENVETVAQATDARDAYLAALAAIRREPTLDIAISLKLTQLGLDRSIDECLANVEPILDAADEQGTLVMIDMEAHRYVDADARGRADGPRAPSPRRRGAAVVPASVGDGRLRAAGRACASGW